LDAAKKTAAANRRMSDRVTHHFSLIFLPPFITNLFSPNIQFWYENSVRKIEEIDKKSEESLCRFSISTFDIMGPGDQAWPAVLRGRSHWSISISTYHIIPGTQPECGNVWFP
jgi:hypothetical protein